MFCTLYESARLYCGVFKTVFKLTAADVLQPYLELRRVLFASHLCVFFFFSSRRRHTRCSRDWSSDVCSSDLSRPRPRPPPPPTALRSGGTPPPNRPTASPCPPCCRTPGPEAHPAASRPACEIGRASCRERV